jgi:hypothetical protein
MLWPYLLPYPFALAGLLLLGYARRRLRVDAFTAIRLLEELVARRYPELSRGFTWREVLTRLRGELPEGDWRLLAEQLGRYEALKYGGEAGASLDAEALVGLLLRLRWRGSARGAKL